MSHVRLAVRIGFACAFVAVVPPAVAAGCRKKDTPATAEPAKPQEMDGESTGRDEDRRRPQSGPREEPVAVPREAGSGGPVVRFVVPNLSRTIDRIAALVEAARSEAAGSEFAGLLAQFPPADEVRRTASQAIRAGLLGRLLEIPDPEAVDLAAPVRARVLLPSAGSASVVVSVATTRRLDPVRSGRIVGMPQDDGRYLIGIGVEPDGAVAWSDDADPEEDVGVAVELRTAAPALLAALRDFQAATAGGAGMPDWLGRLAAASIGFAIDTLDLDKMVFGLRLGGSDAPITMRGGITHPPGSSMAALWDALGRDAPEFGLTETLDAGGTAWIAARMNPAALVAHAPRFQAAARKFVEETAPEQYRAGLLGLIDANERSMRAMDGRFVARGGRTADGRGAWTLVWGSRGAAARDATRDIGALAAGLLSTLSADLALGAQIKWQPAAAQARGTDVDRLTIEIPRAALGPVADAFQPGTGPLRWDVSIAHGRDRAVLTTDPDLSVIERALAGTGRGGGLAAGSAPARMLAALAEPGLIEIGAVDLADELRHNPAMPCPSARDLPPLHMNLSARASDGGMSFVLTFLPGQLRNALAMAATMARCRTETAAAGTVP